VFFWASLCARYAEISASVIERAVHAAGYKDRAVDKYDVLVAATNQLQDITVWRKCLAE